VEAKPMIELYRVTKRYPSGLTALSEIDLVVEEGEFCFLSGPSGAGKSTFIRLLMCMEPATEGQILVKGRDLRRLKPGAIPYLRRNIGVVFQDFRLLDNRSVYDNVAIALEILGLPRREIVLRVHQTLEMVGLARYHRSLPPTLSGGEQQRVAIARALVNEPAILLADEPTGNLDPALSIEILNLIGDIHRKGTTVIVATHDTSLVDRFPARVLTLNKGFLVHDTARPGVSGSPRIPESAPPEAPSGPEESAA
jgi:cell division transport system ATP-binding protein